MAQNYKAGLIITGDASGGIRAIKATEDELSKLNRGFDRSSRDSRRFGSDAQRAGQQVRGMGDDASHASKGLTLVRQAATLAAAAFSIRQLATYADGWSEINARVLNATKSQDVSEHTMRRLAETARGTYSSLNQTAEAYLNNATTLTELGYSTERQLDLADALNNSLVISATRGQQAESVVNALSKAFAAGELRGDNFNTVIQSGGRVAEALADGLGVTTIQLREMAAAGELTTARVFEALTSQMEVLRKEAEDMPATIEDGWTLIGNASQELVGRIDKAFGASEGIAGIMVKTADVMTASIEPIIDNMDTMQDVALLTATVVGGRYAAAFAASAQRKAADAAQSIANAQANAVATQAVVRRTGAEKQSAMAMLSTARLEEQATRGTAAHALALDNLSRARTRAATAAGAHAAATAASDAAMQRSTASAYAMAAASRAVNGALALVGGPVGVAVLAATALYYFSDELGITSAAAREAKEEIDRLVDSMDDLTHAQYESNRVSLVQKLAEARVEASKLQSQIEELQGQAQNQGMWYQGYSGSATHDIAELNTKLREQQRIIAASQAGIDEYDQKWQDVLESQISGVSIFRTLDQWLMTTGESSFEASRRFNALGDTLGENGEKWDDYIGKLRAARDVMGMTAAESAQYAAAQQGYTGLYADQAAAVAGQTDALSDYQKAIADGDAVEAQAHLARAQRYAEAEAMVQAQLQNIGTLTNLLQGVQTELSAVALSAALVVGDSSGAVAANVASAIQAINNRAAAIRNTTTVTVKNTAANREAAAAAREAEQAAKAQADALESIREEMDPLIRDHKTYVDRVNVLEKALAAGTITQTEFGEAIRWSAEQYTRAASGAEDYEQQTESLVGKYDALNQRAQTLRTELDQIRQRYQTGAITGAQYARMLGNVQNEMDQLARESEDAGDSISHSFTTWGTVADNTLRSVDDSGRDAWRGLIGGSTSALDTVKRGFQQTFAEIAHMLTTQKLTFHAAGFLGLDTSGMPGSRGGMSLGNLGSMKKGWDTVSGLWGGGKAAATTAAGYGATGWASSATGAYGGWAGNAAAGAAQAGGGFMAGVSAAMPWIGAGLLADNVLGLGITDGIVKGLGSLFGGGETKPRLNISTYGSRDSFSHDSVAEGALGVIGFGKGSRRTDEMFGSVEQEREWLAQQAAIDNVTASAARSADEFEAMARAAQGFHSSTSGVAGAVDNMAERTLMVIGALDQGYADSLRGLGLSNDQLAQRVANASNAVRLLDANTARMNLQFNAAADGALISADAMAQQAGGVDNLSGLMSSFYQSFFTDGERAAHLQGEITDALASMGMALPENIAGFRALVEAQNQNTAEGARNYVQLLQLSDGFVQLQQMMGDAEGATDGLNAAIRSNADIAREREQLELQLLRAEGDVTEIRRRELAALDASNRPLQERLHAIEDEAEATKASNDVVREYQQLELQLLREQGNTTELRRRELAALHESNRPLQQRIWALQDEAATYSQHLVTNGNVDTIRRAYDTYNASIEAINEGARLREQQLANEQRALTTLRDLTDSLMLSSQSVLDPMERMQEAQRQLSRLQIQAEAGDTNAIGQLQGATTAYLDSIAAVYGQSSAQYAAEFESVSRSMQALENRYGDSVRALGTQESISRDALREQQRARDLLTRQLQQQADMYGELDSIAHLLEYLPQELASALSSILDNGKPGGGIGLAQVISGARNAHGYLDDAGARVVYDYLKNTGGTLSDANRYLKPGANTAEDWARRNGLPLFDTGAWNLGGDTLAMVHKNEFIAPAKGGIADEFRAYAAGDYQAELLGELHRLQQGLTQRPAMAPVSGNDQALLRAFAAMREDNRRLTEQVGAMEQQLAAIVKNTGAVIDPARRTAMATEGAERSTRLKKRNPA